MSFGYQSLYTNGLNSNTQIRRSVDMVYQRGGTYEVVLTGTTYEQSMELDIDLYSNDAKVGRMSLVPANVQPVTGGYSYSFNLRPYEYLSNYVQTEHYQNYWAYDWYTTTNLINVNNPYPNGIKANFKYGYRYINFSGQTVTESSEPSNDLNHYTQFPDCVTNTIYTPSGYTSTGPYFDYIGGQFQMDDKFILQNFDQEIGTTIGTGLTVADPSIKRRISPMSQFLMDYPSVPEMSSTARFLTDAPRIQYVQSNENYVLWYLNGQTGDRQVIEADYAIFEFYDSNNILLGKYNQELNFADTPYASPTGYTDNLKIFSLPCGPRDINNLFVQFDYSSVAYYRVQLFYSWATSSINRTQFGPIGPVSETFYFYLYDNCLPESTRLAFLNDRGGYDYFTFRSYRQDTKKMDRQTFDNRYYSPALQSPDRNVGRSTKTFDTNVEQEIVLESDYLSVPIGQWLEQLFISPQVYVMNTDFLSPIDVQNKFYKDLHPVIILSTEVNTITKKHQKLNKYRITLKSSDNFFANKGF
jgi:hypothetical protein